MSPQQRAAWFKLIVALAVVVLYAALVPFVGPKHALVAFAICGLWGLEPFFFRKGPDGKRPILDERDHLISIRAQVAGLWIFWEFLLAACMIIWATLRYYYHRQTISVDLLPQLFLGSVVIFQIAYSLAILIQYGRSTPNENA